MAEGLVPDHRTLAEFFSKFRPELKSLFKQVCKIAMTMGLICVMPNKEGGIAPNFTPTCLTDSQSGFILNAAVINEVNEYPEALPAVERATSMCGESPVNFLADGGMATGSIIAGLKERRITGFVPVNSNETEQQLDFVRG